MDKAFEKGEARQIDAPAAPITKAVSDLWHSLFDRGALPKRNKLAAQLKELTPYIYIIDILNDGADFRMRFMGSTIVQSIGQDYTGIKMSDYTDESSHWREAVYRQVYETRQPIFTRVSLSDFGKGHVMTESALFPLANSEGEFTMILCCATAL